MAPHLHLRILLSDKKVCKTISLDPSLLIYDVCKAVRDKEGGPSPKDHQPQDWGLFLSDDDPKKGIWLEPGRTLEYYLLRDGDQLEYRKKIRPLRIRMMDESVKTILVDDSQPVSQLMIAICGRIGIANYEEYSLVRDFGPTGDDNNKFGTLPFGTGQGSTAANASNGNTSTFNGSATTADGSTTNYGTLRSSDSTLLRKDKTLTRDQRKMEQLKRKLHTDDEINWVDHTKTLREQGIDEGDTLLLRRKYFYSDQNIDSRDPVQLNLLYVQCRDAIVNGTHPVTLFQACQFSGIQCQIQFGNHDPLKHRTGFLDLNEFIVKDFRKMKGLERKIYEEHKTYVGDGEIDAKVKYVKLARGLKTYGVTFFLVKEKMKGKNKLTPRLLGVTKESVLRLDEKTKEMIKTWQLTSVKRWAASPNSFTLDFGDYQDAYYSVQTPDGEQISRLLAGYIDIILKRKKAKEHTGIGADDESSLVEEIVSPHRATYVQLKRPIGQRHDGPPGAGHVALTGTLGHVTPAGGRLTIGIGRPLGASVAAMTGTETDPPLPDHAPLTGRVRINRPAHPTQRARIIGLCSSQVDTGIRTLRGLSQGSSHQNGHHHVKWSTADPSSLEANDRGTAQRLAEKIGTINAASARIVSLMSMTSQQVMSDHSDDVEVCLGDALKRAISGVTVSLGELVNDIMALEGDIGGSGGSDPSGAHKSQLLAAARELAQATSDMLECLGSLAADDGLPQDNGDGHLDHETQILTARVLQNQERALSAHLTKVGEAGARVLNLVYPHHDSVQDGGPGANQHTAVLLGLAKGVANAAAGLVLRAKTIANHCVSPSTAHGPPPMFGDEASSAKPGPNTNSNLVNGHGMDNISGEAVSEERRGEWNRDRIVMAATRCAMRTSELVTCVKIMAPTMNTAVCREQTIESAKCVSHSVDHVLDAAKDVTAHEKLLSDLKSAATQVVEALDKLIEKVTEGVPTNCTIVPEPDYGERGASRGTVLEVSSDPQTWALEQREKDAFYAIEGATEKIMRLGDDCHGPHLTGPALDSSSMIQEARIVAQATSDLVAAIKGEAQKIATQTTSHGDDEYGAAQKAGRQKRLFEAAKELAEATARLVEKAKQFASNPNYDQREHQADGHRAELSHAAQNLKLAARSALHQISSHRVITELQNAAKDSVESAAQVIKVTQQVLQDRTTQSAQSWTDGDSGDHTLDHDLVSHCKLVGERLADLMSGIEGCNETDPRPDQVTNGTTAITKGGVVGVDGTYCHISPGATLVHSCDRFIGPAYQLTRSLAFTEPVPLGTDPVRNRLQQSVVDLTRSLGQLKTCSDKAHQVYDHRPDVSDSSNNISVFEAAIEKIETIKHGVLSRSIGTKDCSENGSGERDPIVVGAKAIGTDMASFISAVVKGDRPSAESSLSRLVRDADQFSEAVVSYVLGGGVGSGNQIVCELLSLRAGSVLDKCVRVVREAGQRFEPAPEGGTNGGPELQQNLSNCARDLSTCLNDFVNSLPNKPTPTVDEAARAKIKQAPISPTTPTKGNEKLTRAMDRVKDAQRIIHEAFVGELNRSPDQENEFSRLPMEQKRKVFEDVQRDLRTKARDLNHATQVLLKSSSSAVGARYPGPPAQPDYVVETAAEQFSTTFQDFVRAGINVLSTKEEPAVRQKLVSGLEKISTVASRLLTTASQNTCARGREDMDEGERDGIRDRLVLAARSVTDAINDLINYCASNEPGASRCSVTPGTGGPCCMNECQSAVGNIEASRHLLSSAPFVRYPRFKQGDSMLSRQSSVPSSNGRHDELSYYKVQASLENFAAQLNGDAETMTHLARDNAIPEFGAAILSYSQNVGQLCEKVAQCAFIMSLSHEVCDSRSFANNQDRDALIKLLGSNVATNGSDLGSEPVINVQQLNQAASSINEACASIRDFRGNNQQQILTAATIVAKHTSSLCNCCRVASSRTQDPELKKFFVRRAKDVANATSELVKRIKGLDASEFPSQGGSDRSALPGADDSIAPNGTLQSLEQSLAPLTKSVKTLVDYAASTCTSHPNPSNASPNGTRCTKSQGLLHNDVHLSHEAKLIQQPLVESGTVLCQEAMAMMGSCQRLANDPKSPHAWHEFSQRSHDTTEHLGSLVTISRDLAPGQVDCDRTSRKLYDMLNEMEAITMEALNHGLRPNPNDNSQGFKEHATVCAAQLLTLVDSLRVAGKSEAGLIALKLTKFETYMHSLVESYVGHTSHTCTQDSRRMINDLDRLKTVIESSQQLVMAVKAGGGNQRAERSILETIDESAEGLKEGLRDLVRGLELSVDEDDEPMRRGEEEGTASDWSSSTACDSDWLLPSFSRLVEIIRDGLGRLDNLDEYAAINAPPPHTAYKGELGPDDRQSDELRARIEHARILSRDIAMGSRIIAHGLSSTSLNHTQGSVSPSVPVRNASEIGSSLESCATRIAQLFDQLIYTYATPESGIIPCLANMSPSSDPSAHLSHNDIIYELPDRLRYASRQLGESCLDLVRFAGVHYQNIATSVRVANKENGVAASPRGRLSNGASPQSAASVQLSSRDTETAKFLTQKTEEKVGHVIHLLDTISNGLPPDAAKRRTERACTRATHTLRGLIGDLDTTVMFATTGSLRPDDDGDNTQLFAQYRDVILKTAKLLVEDTKTLVAGAASNPEQLAAAAQSAVRTIAKLSEEVKLGASALGPKDPEAQVLLINAIKDVASALGDLIQATKQASGKPLSDPAMSYLKESAKVMVTNVTSLLKTVKTVEDAKLRGTRAVESTIQALTQELRAYDTYDAPLKSASPPELMRTIYNVHAAASDTCLAGEGCSQEEVISASNQCRRSVSDMLRACKGAAQYADNEINRNGVLDGGKCITIKCRDMLEILHQIVTTNPTESSDDINVARLRGEMTRTFSDLNNVLDRFSHLTNECLKVSSNDTSACYYFTDTGSVYSNGSTQQPASVARNGIGAGHTLAENELLNAASAIEAAARNLAVLDNANGLSSSPQLNISTSIAPKNIEYKLAEDEGMKQNFDGQILDAVKAIANATAALIRAASAAQRELVMQGKLSPDTLPRDGRRKDKFGEYGNEGQWSYGLISAAKLVVAATHSMCESANDLVKQKKRSRLSLEPGGAVDQQQTDYGSVTTCEERLVSSAKSVASSTAQLLVACRVKAGIHNPVTENLQSAGNAIKRATDQLVRAATRAIGQKRENVSAYNGDDSCDNSQYDDGDESGIRYITIDKRMVGSLAQEMEAQQEILRKERELEEARVRLGVIRKAKYKDKNLMAGNPNPDYQQVYGLNNDIYNHMPIHPDSRSPNNYCMSNEEESSYISDF